MERIYKYKREGILFKILPFLLIAMYAIMCLFGSSVQATVNEAYTFDYDNHTITYDNKTYKINDDIFSKKYICFTSNGGLSISVFCSDYPFYVDGSAYSSTSDKFYTVRSYDENKFYYYTFTSSNMHNVLPYLQSWDLSHYSTTTGISSSFKFGPEYTYFSNFDIKDENDEVVFRGASPELAGVTIPAIQSAEEIPQAIIKTMKVVIPVGLVILGIGLVIYLIKSAILRMQ